MKDKQEELRLELHTKFNLVFNEAVAADTVDRLVKYLDSFELNTRTHDEWENMYKVAVTEVSKDLLDKYKNVTLAFKHSYDPESGMPGSGDFIVAVSPKKYYTDRVFLKYLEEIRDHAKTTTGYHTLVDKDGWFMEGDKPDFKLNYKK